MSARQRFVTVCFLAVSMLVSGCGPSQSSEPMFAPTLTATVTLIPAVTVTSTPQEHLPALGDISQSTRDICEEKANIGCMSDCVDGFNEYCYFDSTEHKKDELESGESFPEETRQACFGIHSFNECGVCHNRFELNRNGEFEEVSCEEFFQAIEDKNKSCGGCLDEKWAGCC